MYRSHIIHLLGLKDIEVGQIRLIQDLSYQKDVKKRKKLIDEENIKKKTERHTKKLQAVHARIQQLESIPEAARKDNALPADYTD